MGQTVQFVYTSWERIVLNGYIERLQRPQNLIYFFPDAVVGVARIEPAVLEQRTNTYKAWVRRFPTTKAATRCARLRFCALSPRYFRELGSRWL